MIKATSKVKLNFPKIKQLQQSQIAALEQTAEALHTEVVQAQVMPFDDPQVTEKRVYGKRGQFAKNGREYKGKLVKETVHGGGTLQNESTFVDYSRSNAGTVSLVSSTPYARRLYFHPEYNFDKGENPNAKGRWLEDWAEPPDGNGNKSEWIRKTFKELYRRLAGL